ncbi:MAG: phosphatidylserine decarboxylase family protein [Planctomycetes bacterium]|nr:phosphatidylserine decarboxylase family protein [Planctomycetota bacterium]
MTAVVAWLVGVWAVLPAVLALALLSFYRDPPRRIPPGDDLLVSPADGKVTEVVRHERGKDGPSEQWRVCIFLSVANVHLNRSPCAGRVADVTYTPGKFINALNPAAVRVNENSVLTLEPTPPIPGPIRIRQVSGALARRIVCEAKPGDELTTGERFGMIKLGSRTEIVVPEHACWEVVVKVGDSVRGGSTVLARLRRTERDEHGQNAS